MIYQEHAKDPQFDSERKQRIDGKIQFTIFSRLKTSAINFRMANWNYFLKIAALTAIDAHISLWNGFGHLPQKS
jgi:hypothetical protein